MAAAYAHYRFAAQALQLLDSAAQKKIARFRHIYDAGAQGPDCFFYVSPLFPTAQSKLGRKFHAQSGKAFFTAAVRRLRLHPTEVGTVYLYGVLTHYCLDSCVHAYIAEKEKDGSLSHAQMEAEFDRFLLTQDGKIPAHAQDLSQYIHLSRAECFCAAELYPGADPYAVLVGIRNMRHLLKLFSNRNRRATEFLVGLGGKSARQILIPRTATEGSDGLDADLLGCYEAALTRLQQLVPQFTAFQTNGSELGDDFCAIFG